jgi:hypothetical protein
MELVTIDLIALLVKNPAYCMNVDCVIQQTYLIMPVQNPLLIGHYFGIMVMMFNGTFNNTSDI